IKSENDEQLRDLTKEEVKLIIPLFYRVKEYFDFEDIAKKLAGKKTIGHYKNAQDRAIKQVLFNYELDTTVTACTTCAKLKNVFGENWKEELVNRYTDKTTKLGRKTEADIIQDVWHVLFTFDSEVKLREFAQVKLGVSEETADRFARISLKQGYASLSLKAIKKISYWLQRGLTYAHSVFMANIPYILPQEIWAEVSNQELIVSEIKGLIDSYTTTKKQFEIINSIVKSSRDSNSTWGDSDLLAAEYRKDVENKLSQLYGKSEWLSKSQQERDQEVDRLFVILEQQMVKNGGKGDFIKIPTLKEEIIRFLSDQFDLSDQSLAKLYHPSEVTPFAPARKNEDGIYQLGSPRISSVKNPVVMRAMFQLRKLINELLAQHIITELTPIRVEMARELNDANKRRAIKLYQDGRQKKRESYKKEIIDLFKAQGKTYEPNDEDILKYELWLEQNKQCLYTGDTICICDFVGADPKYDIEHTIPQSVSFDNSRVNKTICENKFNRETKNNRLPSQLANHDAILIRVSHWDDQIDAIKKNIKKADYRVKGATTKEAKDNAIVARHLLKIDLDYWTRKYNTFVIKEVKDGFKNSQLVDTGSITRYTLFYLKSLFKRVDVLKGSATADLRKLWGIQDEFEVKSRETHLHHAVDAIVLASVPRNISDLLQQYYLDKEREHGVRKSFRKPWNTFVEDIKTSQADILVDHVNRDNLLKTTKKKLRKRGAILRNQEGDAKITQGHSARGALHQESFYGAVMQEGNKVFVKRRFLSDLKEADIKNIIDPVVQKKVQAAVDEKGMKVLKETVWMHEEKRIPIVKVRCKTTKKPIVIKKHRDLSSFENKQFVYVANDSNHKMYIFEDFTDDNSRKKPKRGFALLSNYNSIQLRGVVQADIIKQLKIDYNVPVHFGLKQELVAGSKILLWEEVPEELFDCKPNELQERYYIITGLSIDAKKNKKTDKEYLFATIVLRHAIEARPSTALKVQDGAFFVGEDYKPLRKLNHNQFNALVEGIDFKFNILGGIEKIE
ncbi:MAG: type II CRISPR RNA-guided endonuclease Cas9, partial [Tannerellaceae bacterium]